MLLLRNNIIVTSQKNTLSGNGTALSSNERNWIYFDWKLKAPTISLKYSRDPI